MPQNFAGKLERSTKRGRGRTTVESTPITIRSGVPMPPKFEDRIRASLTRKLGHAASLIERGTVRFEDVNGPRGGRDTVCRIKLVVSGRPAVQAEDRAHGPEGAFALTSQKIQRALARVRGKHGLTTGRRPAATAATRVHARVASPRATTTRSESPVPKAKQRTHKMKLATARRPASRKAVKVKASRSKARVGVQRGARR
jgi:hypothetical protein